MKTIASTVLTALAYATVRYNAFKGVPWDQWPTFVVNKAAALSALLLVVIFLLRRRVRVAGGQRLLLATASWLVALHVGLSLALFTPATYPKLFAEGRPVATVAWSLLLAAAAAGTFLRSRHPDGLTDRGWPLRLGLLAFASGLHAALLGYEGWFAPSSWPGFLVPITLIAFVAGVIGLWAGARGARDGR